jgi:hypothetical protein
MKYANPFQDLQEHLEKENSLEGKDLDFEIRQIQDHSLPLSS